MNDSLKSTTKCQMHYFHLLGQKTGVKKKPTDTH